MKILKNLILAGIGIATAKYYINKPEKLTEHKEIAKEKLNQSVQYSQFLINYAKKNGTLSSIEYISNDFDKLVKDSLDKIGSKTTGPIHYGIELIKDRENLKEQVAKVKEKGITLTTNVTEATKVIKDEVKPKVDSYLTETKSILANIKNKTQDIKDTIAQDKAVEKINTFSSQTKEKLEVTNEKIEELKNKKAE